jgi:mRNA interferase RelE/StbE
MYSVDLVPAAFRQLKKLPRDTQEKIGAIIENLKTDQYPRGCSKLIDQPGYRIREGNYRIIYDPDKKKKAVKIIAILDRKEAYR